MGPLSSPVQIQIQHEARRFYQLSDLQEDDLRNPPHRPPPVASPPRVEGPRAGRSLPTSREK